MKRKALVPAVVLFLLMLVSCRHRKQEAALSKKPQKAKFSSQSVQKVPQPQSWQQALGVGRKEMKESRLYSFIGEWYGTPYKYGGCIKSGVDCSCFASLLSEKVYHRALPRSASEMFQQSEKFNIEEAREGDLVFFKIQSKSISHVGVYLGKKHFVHSSTSQGVSVNSLDEAYYKKYFYCAGRMKGK